MTRRLLAGLAKRSLRGKRRELAGAVPGLMRDHHRFVLRRHLDLTTRLTRQIERIEARIAAETSGPFGAVLDLLESIPAVRRRPSACRQRVFAHQHISRKAPFRSQHPNHGQGEGAAPAENFGGVGLRPDERCQVLLA